MVLFRIEFYDIHGDLRREADAYSLEEAVEKARRMLERYGELSTAVIYTVDGRIVKVISEIIDMG